MLINSHGSSTYDCSKIADLSVKALRTGYHIVEVGSNSTKTGGGHDLQTVPERARRDRFFGILLAKKLEKLAKLRTFERSKWVPPVVLSAMVLHRSP